MNDKGNYGDSDKALAKAFLHSPENFVKSIVDSTKTNLVLCRHTIDCSSEEFLKKSGVYGNEAANFGTTSDLNKGFTWCTTLDTITGIFTHAGNSAEDKEDEPTSQDHSQENYKMFEEVEKDTGEAAHRGINQVITKTKAGSRLGTEDFSAIGNYFTEMGLADEEIKMMVTPETKAENALSMQGTDRINGISLQAATLLPTHKTGVLFEKGLINHTSTNNTETSEGEPYMLNASAFWPNGPHTEGQPTTVTAPDEEKRTTKNQLYLWGCKTLATMKSELNITDDKVPPLLRKGDVLEIEGVQNVQPQSKGPQLCRTTFTVCEDVAFPEATATTPTGITSDPAGAVAVNISPGIDLSKVSLGAKIRVLAGLESRTKYKVEYACPKSAIALLSKGIEPKGSWQNSIIMADFSSGQTFRMRLHHEGSIRDLSKKGRFDSIYGVKVISPQHCIKHFVNSE